jgi:hypothetical protein
MGLLSRGRKKLFAERLTLPMSTEMLADVDKHLKPHEVRLDFIREAIAELIGRRRTESVAYVVGTVSSEVNGHYFYSLTLKRGDDTVFSEEGFEGGSDYALNRVLDKAQTFGVSAVVFPDWEGKSIIYRKDGGRFHPYKECPPLQQSEILVQVNEIEFLATQGQRGHMQ